MRSSTRVLIVALAAAVSVVLAGCGGSKSEDGELVALKTHMDFDFRMDPTDGPEHVFSTDSELFLDRDGLGTYTSDGEVREFEASPEQLSEVEDALADLDLDGLAEEFDAEADMIGTFTITYEGRTKEIGTEVVDQGFGSEDSGSEDAEQFIAAVLLLDELSKDEASPATSRFERDRERLSDCIAKKAPHLCLGKGLPAPPEG